MFKLLFATASYPPTMVMKVFKILEIAEECCVIIIKPINSAFALLKRHKKTSNRFKRTKGLYKLNIRKPYNPFPLVNKYHWL